MKCGNTFGRYDFIKPIVGSIYALFSNKLIKKASIGLWLFSICFLSNLFVYEVYAQHQSPIKLLPFEDTYVFEREPDTNFGSNEELIVRTITSESNWGRATFIKFDISQIDTAKSAKLRLYSNWIQSEGITVHAREASNNWNESTLTWNNTPTGLYEGDIIDTITVNDVESYYEFDITDYIESKILQGETIITIALTGEGALRVDFNSREAPENKPYLEVIPKKSNIIITPIEDTYIRSGVNANTNYGTSSNLEVKRIGTGTSDHYRGTLIKFNIPQIDIVEYAKLKLFCHWRESTGPITVHVREASNNWDESTLTWNNTPEGTFEGEIIDTIIIDTAGMYYEFDLTEYINEKILQGERTFSISITEDEFRLVQFYSSESAHSIPFLKVTPYNINTIIHPTQDTYVRGSENADINYGSLTSFAIKRLSSPNTTRNYRATIIRFDIPEIDGAISAKLNLFCNDVQDTAEPIFVSAREASNDWDENTLTWSNMLGGNNPGGLFTWQTITGTNVFDTNMYYQFDITEYINAVRERGRTSFSIAFTENSNRVIVFNSRESNGNRPFLEIKPLLEKSPGISAGEYTTIALEKDGTAWAWGNNRFGQLGNVLSINNLKMPTVINSNNIVMVSSGESHVVSLKNDMKVWTWGNNGYGQLGDGTRINRSRPVEVRGIDHVIKVAAGRYHSVALTAYGKVWTWGLNSEGQLGIGPELKHSTMPLLVDIDNVIDIAQGYSHTLALKSDGTVWAWGNNADGQLGENTTTNRTTPIQVAGLVDIVRISAGAHHTVVLKEDGTIQAWGRNDRGQLGYRTVVEAFAIVGETTFTVPKGVTEVDVLVVGGGGGGGNSRGGGGGAGGLIFRPNYDVTGKTDITVRVGDGGKHVPGGNPGTNGENSVFDTLVALGGGGGGAVSDSTNPENYNGKDGGSGGGARRAHQSFDTLGGSGLQPYQPGDSGSPYGFGNDGGMSTANSNNQAGGGGAGSPGTAGGTEVTGGRGLNEVEINGVTYNFANIFGTNYGEIIEGEAWFAGGGAGASGFVQEGGGGQGGNTSAPSPGKPNTGGGGGGGTTDNGTDGGSGIVIVRYQIGEAINFADIDAGYFHTVGLKNDGTVWTWGGNSYGQLGDGTNLDSLTPIRIMNNVSQISAGYFHTVVKREDGTIYSWGRNDQGQLGDKTNIDRNTPVRANKINTESKLKIPEQPRFINIGAGNWHTLAVKSDGSMWSWGRNNEGQLGNNTTSNSHTPVQVVGAEGIGYLENIIQVAGGQRTTAVLKNDGTVWTSGLNSVGELGDGTTTDRQVPVQVLGEAGIGYLDGIVKVAIATHHMLAIKVDGTVWAWGHNFHGRLGDGTFEDRSTPVQVRGKDGIGYLDNIIQVAGGDGHSVALKNDGTVWTWGRNSSGQLGDGTTSGRNTPRQVLGEGGVGYLTDIIEITSGTNHIVALRNDGTVWAWGLNDFGQLGDGTTENRSTPVKVAGGLQNVVQVSSKFRHTVALKNNGTLWAWGENDSGQLGDDTRVHKNTPVKVRGSGGNGYLENIIEVVTGHSHTVALKNDGTVWSWGGNSNGHLGDGTTTRRETPVQVQGVKRITPVSMINISSGDAHALALKSDGTLWAWGYNWAGQLGDGTTTDRHKPIKVNSIKNIKQVAGGSSYTVALRDDRTVWSWGRNNVGQLGDGTTSNRLTPVQVVGEGGVGYLHDIVQVAAGINYTTVLKEDGTVWSWGSNDNGQLGDGTTSERNTPAKVVGVGGEEYLNNIVQVSSGNQHTLALKSDGTVWSWGSNTSRQLGVGDIASTSTPVQVLGESGVGYLGDIVQVWAGDNHSLALKADGTVFAWGNNFYGQLGDGNFGIGVRRGIPERVNGEYGVGDLKDIVQIAAGERHGLALSSDGTVWSWGGNFAGQLGDGTTDNRYAPVQVKNLYGADKLTNITGISAGMHYTLAVSRDGTVWAWGRNNWGQLGNRLLANRVFPVKVDGFNLIEGVSNTKTNHPNNISAGVSYALALKSDGTVWSWGSNLLGGLGDGTSVSKTRPVQVVGEGGVGYLRDIVNITARRHSMALCSDGKVWSWGLNDYGQLGDGTTTNRATPVRAHDLENVIQVGPGREQSIVLKADGTVWSWGRNNYGQLGDGSTADRLTPARINALEDVVQLQTGGDNSIVLKADGTVWTWGYNLTGQLGDGTSTNRTTPVQVKGEGGSGYLEDIVQVATQEHGLALRADGTVWAWGNNNYGRLGDGTTELRRTTPVQVVGEGGVGYLENVVQIRAGSNYSLALSVDGTVWTWGMNRYGQLGDGTTTNSNIPVKVAGEGGVGYLENVVQVGAGGEFNIALKADGTVWAWGFNQNGRLGDGTTTNRNTPVRVSDLNLNIEAQMNKYFLPQSSSHIVANEHTIALKTDGSVWSWGKNNYGQLGDATTINRDNPIRINNLEGVAQAVVGTEHSAVLKRDGTVWSWGRNNYGQLGDVTNTNSFEPVQVRSVSGDGHLEGIVAITSGNNHIVTLKDDGSVWSWGKNNYGQLGDGTTVNRNRPVEVTEGIIAISSRSEHTVALKSDGSVWTWGINDYGQLGDGTTTNKSLPVQVLGEDGVGYLKNIVRIAAGVNHTVALKEDGTVWVWGGNNRGQLADGTIGNRTTPVKVKYEDEYLTEVLEIVAGENHTLALKEDGTVWEWKDYRTVYNQDGLNFSGKILQNEIIDPVMTGYNNWPDGFASGSWLFAGGVFDGENIWLIPRGANMLVKFNPETETMTGYTGWPEGVDVGDNNKFYGSVYDGENIWMIPSNSDVLVKFNIETETMTGYNNWPDGFASGSWLFAGGVFDGENIWMIPRSANMIVKVNALTGEMTGYDNWPGGFSKDGNAFMGGVYDGENLWMMPDNADRVIKINTSTGVMEGYNNWPTGFDKTQSQKFIGGAYDGENIWMMPFRADKVVKIDTSTGVMTEIDWPSGFSKVHSAYTAGIYDGVNIWMVNRRASGVMKINVKTEEMTEYTMSVPGYAEIGSSGAFTGGVYDGENIWLIPHSANMLVKLAGEIPYKNTPVQIAELENVKQISAGNGYLIAIKKDKTVWIWGSNAYGQLGDGTRKNRYTPEKIDNFEIIPQLRRAERISAGGYHSLMLGDDGRLYSWGRNNFGQLGDGTTIDSNITVQVRNGLEGVEKISTGKNHSLALKNDGTVWTWGRANYVNLMYEHEGEIIYNQDGLGFSGSIIANEVLDPVMKEYNNWPEGFTKRSSAFWGGVYDGSNIWMIPRGADSLIKVNASTGEMTGYDDWPGEFTKDSDAFAGGVYDGENIWMIPRSADSVIKVNASTGEMTGYNNWPEELTKGLRGFLGGVYDGTNIWMIPNDANMVIKMNVTTGEMTGYNNWPDGFTKGGSAFSGGVYDGENIWMIPRDADRLIKVNVSTGEMTGYNDWPGGFAKGNRAFYGGVYDGSNIWMIPTDADRVIKVNASTGEMTGYNSWPKGFTKGSGAFVGGVYDGSNIWMIPLDGDRVIKVNASTGEMTGYNNWPQEFTKGGSAFLGGVYDGSNIWMIPNNATSVIKLSAAKVYKEPVQVIELEDIVGISTKNHHSLALKADGTVWSWGENNYGQLGDGTTTDNYSPEQVTNLINVKKIAAGEDHSVALKADGTVWVWGRNDYGQLGDGTTVNRNTPMQVPHLENIEKIVAGRSHTLALASDGTVWAWGRNNYGQLGDGTRNDREYPVRVRNLTNVVAIDASENHTIVLKEDGTVWGWGDSSKGQIGDGTDEYRVTPGQLSYLKNITKISAGKKHGIAVDTIGRVWTWGDNTYGQLEEYEYIRTLQPIGLLSISMAVIEDLEYARLTDEETHYSDNVVFNIKFKAAINIENPLISIDLKLLDEQGDETGFVLNPIKSIERVDGSFRRQGPVQINVAGRDLVFRRTADEEGNITTTVTSESNSALNTVRTHQEEERNKLFIPIRGTFTPGDEIEIIVPLQLIATNQILESGIHNRIVQLTGERVYTEIELMEWYNQGVLIRREDIVKEIADDLRFRQSIKILPIFMFE